VERLRGHWRAAGQGCTSLCRECTAADEIERLRAELEEERQRRRGDLIGQQHRDDEIERLRAEVEAWRAAATGAADQAIRFQEVLTALNVRMAQPHMGGGGHFMASGNLTAEQAATVAAFLAAATPKEDDR
jgi:hypothetical protein